MVTISSESAFSEEAFRTIDSTHTRTHIMSETTCLFSLLSSVLTLGHENVASPVLGGASLVSPSRDYETASWKIFLSQLLSGRRLFLFGHP